MSGGPSTSDSASPNLGEIMNQAAKAHRAGLHTWMPGQVIAYDKNRQRADVQPLIQRGYTDEDGSRVPEALPVVTDVPMMFIGNDASGITWPIKVGDVVKLDFCEASLDLWLANGGGNVDPNDDRRHSISDAVAAQGLRATALPANSTDDIAMVMRFVKLKIGGSTANDPVLRVSDLATILSVFNDHVHGTPGGTGGPSTSPTTTMSSPAGSPDVFLK